MPRATLEKSVKRNHVTYVGTIMRTNHLCNCCVNLYDTAQRQHFRIHFYFFHFGILAAPARHDVERWHCTLTQSHKRRAYSINCHHHFVFYIIVISEHCLAEHHVRAPHRHIARFIVVASDFFLFASGFINGCVRVFFLFLFLFLFSVLIINLRYRNESANCVTSSSECVCVCCAYGCIMT